MTPLLAIHPRQGSYSERWMAYCANHDIAVRKVNCFASDIVDQLVGADALLWHWMHNIPEDVRTGFRIIQTAEEMGLTVFPNRATCWHYDDKVSQKYLLEAIGAKAAQADVFYDLESALKWIETAAFPKVFKLSRGAGSMNVQLVRIAEHARRLAIQAFGRGFKPVASILGDAKSSIRRHRKKGDMLAVLRRLPQMLANIRRMNREIARERGYVYFQEFLPDNEYDTRVTIIGDRAFGFRRMVRANDFRASGSANIVYDASSIDLRCIESAFRVANRLGTQSLAFDFVKDRTGAPTIVEISYCYLASAVYECTGHWDSHLNWHEGRMWPQDAILIDLLEALEKRQSFSHASTTKG